MSHWGKNKVVIIVRLHILDICFTKNDYFLKNSRYTIFQKNKTKNRIKSMRNVKEAKDLTRIPIEETMMLRATLYQDKSQKETNKFLPKVRKIVIRQLSKLRTGDAVYRDIGAIELQLHEVLAMGKMRDYELRLIDPEKKAEAVIRVTVEWDHYETVVKEGQIPLKSKCFGLCKPDPAEIRYDPKVNTEFFQQLRLRFNPEQQPEDEDLAGIPVNASVYGALDQSYSDLLAPNNPHRQHNNDNSRPLSDPTSPGDSTESLLADLNITRISSMPEMEEGEGGEEGKKADYDNNNSRNHLHHHHSNNSVNGSETGSQMSSSRRSLKDYTPTMKWTGAEPPPVPPSSSLLDRKNSANNQSFDQRALPALPSERNLLETTSSPSVLSSSNGLPIKQNLSSQTSSQIQAVTDTEEDQEDAIAKEKLKQSRVIAKKLRKLARHNEHHSSISSKADAKILFLGSDDESIEGKETDEPDDRSAESAVGEIVHFQPEISPRGSSARLSYNGGNSREHSPVLDDPRNSENSKNSLIQRVLSKESRYNALDPNLSFRLSTSSNTQITDSNRASLRQHRFPSSGDGLDDGTLASDLSSHRHSHASSRGGGGGGSQRYSSRSASNNLYYSAVYQQKEKRISSSFHSNQGYSRRQGHGRSPPPSSAHNYDQRLLEGDIRTRKGMFASSSRGMMTSEETIGLDLGADLEELQAH